MRVRQRLSKLEKEVVAKGEMSECRLNEWRKADRSGVDIDGIGCRKQTAMAARTRMLEGEMHTGGIKRCQRRLIELGLGLRRYGRG